MLGMPIRSLAVAASLVAAGSATALPSPGEAPARLSAEPEVFSTAGLESDRTRSVDENRVHVIYATATWCPPCKKMKAETWVDEDVVAWLDANAVVTPLDVDQFRSDAATLRVRAMPTIMVFNGSTEIARTVGYQAPGQFRSWLESSTGRGITTRTESAEAPASRESIQDMLVNARNAMLEQRFDDAAEAYAWLWDNMRQDRAADDLRRGAVAEQIAKLVSMHGAARAPFVDRRNQIGSQLPAIDADDASLLDWMTLNGALDQNNLTVGWVSSALDDRQSLAFLRKHQQRVRPLLTEADAWEEAAAVVNNPFAAARLELMELKQAQRETGATGIDAGTLASLADLYAIANTIDRAGFAERVASLVLRTSDTPEIRRALVSRAIDAGYTKPTLAELIEDDSSAEAEALRSQLDG